MNDDRIKRFIANESELKFEKISEEKKAEIKQIEKEYSWLPSLEELDKQMKETL